MTIDSHRDLQERIHAIKNGISYIGASREWYITYDLLGTLDESEAFVDIFERVSLSFQGDNIHPIKRVMFDFRSTEGKWSEMFGTNVVHVESVSGMGGPVEKVIPFLRLDEKLTILVSWGDRTESISLLRKS